MLTSYPCPPSTKHHTPTLSFNFTYGTSTLTSLPLPFTDVAPTTNIFPPILSPQIAQPSLESKPGNGPLSINNSYSSITLHLVTNRARPPNSYPSSIPPLFRLHPKTNPHQANTNKQIASALRSKARISLNSLPFLICYYGPYLPHAHQFRLRMSGVCERIEIYMKQDLIAVFNGICVP